MDNTIIDKDKIEPNGYEPPKEEDKAKDNTDAAGKSGGKKPGTDQKEEVKKKENIMDTEE